MREKSCYSLLRSKEANRFDFLWTACGKPTIKSAAPVPMMKRWLLSPCSAGQASPWRLGQLRPSEMWMISLPWWMWRQSMRRRYSRLPARPGEILRQWGIRTGCCAVMQLPLGYPRGDKHPAPEPRCGDRILRF